MSKRFVVDNKGSKVGSGAPETTPKNFEFSLKGVNLEKIDLVLSGSKASGPSGAAGKPLRPNQVDEKKKTKYGPSSGNSGMSLGKLKPQEVRKEDFIDRSGQKVKLFTRFRERLMRKNREYEETTSIPCDWCRLKFDTSPLGIPVAYEKGDAKSFALGEDDKKQEVGVWHCIGNFCSTSCAYAFHEGFKDPSFTEETLILLRRLHERLFPGVPFRKAADWRLLKQWGGDLTEEEWRKGNSNTFVRIPGVRIISAGTNYEQRGE